MQAQYEQISTEELFGLFLENRSRQDLKRELVLRYTYLVKTIAMQLRGVYISVGDMEDVINEGIIALMDALERFDPERNVKFSSYASLRIRGAVIDFARKQDWMPRSVRKTAKEIDAATGALQVELGRAPTEHEVAQKLGMELAKYRKALVDSSLYNLLSLDAIIEDSQSEFSFQPMSEHRGGEDSPAARLQNAELHEALQGAILKLKPREQMVVSLYYRKELNMKEISKILGVSEPRISQILAGSLNQLRKSMEEYCS